MNFSGVLNFLNDLLDDDKVEFLLDNEMDDENLLFAENNLGKIVFNKSMKEIELKLEKQSSEITISNLKLNSEAEKELLSSIFKKVSEMIEKLIKEREEDLLESLTEFKNSFK